MSEPLPRDARLIALMLASSPAITDAQPAVLQQLLEFAHRYTAQVLGDALTYADHAGRAGNVQIEDVTLAIQSRVGWEFGGRVPKEHLLSLATKTNAEPLPPLSETYGIRLPAAKHCLTAIDFDLQPNKPPPSDMLHVSPPSSSGEEDNDGEEDDVEMDDDAMDQDPLSPRRNNNDADADGDTNMLTPGASDALALGLLVDDATQGKTEQDSDSDDGVDGLFEDDDDDDEDNDNEDGDGGAGGAAGATPSNSQPQVGEKRKLDEDDEYD